MASGEIINGELATIEHDPLGRVLSLVSAIGGNGGDVVGPGSSTDNAIARFDGITGKLIQSSAAYITDAGSVGVGIATPETLLHVKQGGGTITPLGGTQLTVQSSTACYVTILGASGQGRAVIFGDEVSSIKGSIFFNSAAANGLDFRVNTNITKFLITAGGQLQSVGLGTAGTPNIALSTDTNTGIYWPAADQLAISCGGTMMLHATTTEVEVARLAVERTGGGPIFIMRRPENHGAGATVADVRFQGQDNLGAAVTYGQILCTAVDETAGTMDGKWVFSAQLAGTNTTHVTIQNGQVQIRDGTAALPSLTNLTDTNTGIYWPAADALGIAAAGAEVVRVDTNGLTLTQPATDAVILREIYSDAATQFVRISGGSSAGTGANILAFGPSHGTNAGEFLMSSASGAKITYRIGTSTAMTIDASRNVLIAGTTTPTSAVGALVLFSTLR